MKKVIRTIILVLVCMVVFSGAIYAKTRSGKCGKKVKWRLSSSGTLTISGKGKMKDYIGEFGSKPPWYKYRNKVKKIIVKKGVTRIGCDAFEGCKKAKSVKISGTVKTIGEYAFCDCRSLKKISVPEGVKSLEGYVFSGCKKLEQITLPKSLTELQGWNFSDTPSLKKILYKGSRKQWITITDGGEEDIIEGIEDVPVYFV